MMGGSNDKDFLGRLSVDLRETPRSSGARIGVASVGHDHRFGFFLERILEERCFSTVELGDGDLGQLNFQKI